VVVTNLMDDLGKILGLIKFVIKNSRIKMGNYDDL
jgi:hypothetical protein